VLSGGEVDPTHYGRFSYGLSSLRPHPLDRGRILEAPVTTMPILRVPVHSTFVLSAGQWLFDLGLALSKARAVPINYLLHAADVVERVADPALSSYHFLTQSWDEKRPLYEHMLSQLSETYVIVTTHEFVNLDDRGT
jgi:peptidoglycan-N-acetylglucosamine deacetylase